MSVFKELFEKITENFSVPVKLSKNCEATTFYRVEYLNRDDIAYCAQVLGTRVIDTSSPTDIDFLLEMPGSTSGLAEALAQTISDRAPCPKILTLDEFSRGNGSAGQVRGKGVVIVNDVITTGRSCLEAHSQLTMSGAHVTCWVSLIDRTFGPGPVAVIAALTGEPVRILD